MQSSSLVVLVKTLVLSVNSFLIVLVLLGVEVDREKNLAARFGGEGVITTDNSRVPAMVISTNEELVIAEDLHVLAGL